MSQIDHVVRNGDPVMTYPGCVNLSFSCIEGESLLMALKDIALSSGRYVALQASGYLFTSFYSFFQHLSISLMSYVRTYLFIVF